MTLDGAACLDAAAREEMEHGPRAGGGPARRALGECDRRIACLSRMQALQEIVEDADPGAGDVSWISPVARALMGARVGDTVRCVVPAGPTRLRVLAIRYR